MKEKSEMPVPIEELLRKRNEIDEVIRKEYSQKLTVVFTDIVGSTKYFASKGDIAGRAMVQEHNDLLFPIIKKHHGRTIKTIGDAIMAGFDKAVDGLQAAIRMQERLAEYNQESEDEICIRIGLHTGQAITEPNDIFGDTVNTAARVEGLADGDQILISGATSKEIEKERFNIHSHGNYSLKGLKEEIPIYEVLWSESQRPKRPYQETEPKDTLSMLVVISAPVAARDGVGPPGTRLDLWREWQNIIEAIRIKENQYHNVHITRLFPPTRQRLEETLMNHQYDILHFIGHGTRKGLVFEDEYGREEMIRIDDLEAIFSRGKIKGLAILNACHSYDSGRRLSARIPSVITTTQTILDEAAKLFTRTFYPALFAGQSVSQALERASEEVGKKYPSGAKILSLIGEKETSLKPPITSEQPEVSLSEPPNYKLPYPIGFIGQGKRLVEIAHILEKAENRAIILSGIGGIGKTYLAQMAARRNSWRFPNGIIYFGAEEKTKFEHILEAISGFFRIKPDEVVSRLSMRTCLLVIDNVEVMDVREQKGLAGFIESLDPRQGTKVILTSRAHIPEFESMDAGGPPLAGQGI